MITQFLPDQRQLSSPADIEKAYAHPGGGHVRVNFITSLDGAVEIDGRSGPLGGAPDRAVLMAMRAVCDVVLVGAGTVRAENYGPVRLTDEAQERRTGRGQAPLPQLAIVSGRAEMPVDARVFGGAQVIMYTTEEAARRRPDLVGLAEVVPAGSDTVHMGSVLDDLFDRGLERVLCEGGPQVARSLMDVSRLDELCLTISPVLAGAMRTTLAGSGRFVLTGLAEGEGMLFTRYLTGPRS